MLSQMLANTSIVDAVFGGHLFDGHSSLVVCDELGGFLALDLIDLDSYIATAIRIDCGAWRVVRSLTGRELMSQ